jgi:hypothetical protein
MPYLRLYAQDLQIEQKRVIAQKLIEITLRTFNLSADQRYRTTIQFITVPKVFGVDGLHSATSRDPDLMLEVLGHDLTEGKKRAFANEATAMLTHVLPVKPWSRLARLLGIEVDSPRQVALQFNELSAAVSDPFVSDSQRRAA